MKSRLSILVFILFLLPLSFLGTAEGAGNSKKVYPLNEGEPVFACPARLVAFVDQHLRFFIRKLANQIVRERCFSVGINANRFFQQVDSDDITQRVLIRIYSARKPFQINRSARNSHLTELENNQELRAYVKSRIRSEVSRFIARFMEDMRFPEMHAHSLFDEEGKIAFDDGVFDDVYEGDQPVADIVAERRKIGMRIPDGSPSQVIQATGLTEETLKKILAATGHTDLIKGLSEEYRVTRAEFFAAYGGAYTTADITEAIQMNAVEWMRRDFGEFGDINSASAIAILSEKTARELFEIIAGISLVRDRTLRFMDLSSDKFVRLAAANYRVFYERATPTGYLIATSGGSKATYSWQRKSTQRQFLAAANLMMEYPEVLTLGEGDEKVQLDLLSEAALIRAIEDGIAKFKDSDFQQTLSRSELYIRLRNRLRPFFPENLAGDAVKQMIAEELRNLKKQPGSQRKTAG